MDEPPAAPPPGVVVTPGDSALTVRWDAVSDEVGKPPVSGYEVAHLPGDSGEWEGGQALSSRTDTSVTLTGLTNDQAYAGACAYAQRGEGPVHGQPLFPAHPWEGRCLWASFLRRP